MEMYYWEMEKLIKEITNKHYIECEIKRQPSGLFVPMAYNVDNNTIKFNEYNVCGVIRRCPKLTKEQVLTIITYHEIGHYLDHKYNDYTQEMITLKNTKCIKTWTKYKLDRELKAWEYGKEIIPQSLIKAFDELNEKNMVKYYRKLKEVSAC